MPMLSAHQLAAGELMVAVSPQAESMSMFLLVEISQEQKQLLLNIKMNFLKSFCAEMQLYNATAKRIKLTTVFGVIYFTKYRTRPYLPSKGRS